MAMQVSVSIQRVFGSFIADLRRKAGLHIEQLAEKSGLSGAHLNAIEQGDVNLNLGTMLVLAMSLDTSPQELFSGIAKRIGGNMASQLDASHCNEPSHVQTKPQQLWIGSVEVRPLRGCEVLSYSLGAFVNIVTWAANASEYGEKAARILAEMRLFITDIADLEPVETKRRREGNFEASVEEIITEAAGSPHTTLCGKFYPYVKADA